MVWCVEVRQGKIGCGEVRLGLASQGRVG